MTTTTHTMVSTWSHNSKFFCLCGGFFANCMSSVTTTARTMVSTWSHNLSSHSFFHIIKNPTWICMRQHI